MLIRSLKLAAFGLSLLFFAACGKTNEKVDDDFQPGESGTSEAIMKGNDRLSTPRPGPIGDTAQNEAQRNRFGKLPSNVDSVERANQVLPDSRSQPFD